MYEGHEPQSQRREYAMPNPLSDASVNKCRAECSVVEASRMRDFPFHLGRYVFHHNMSLFASADNTIFPSNMRVDMLRSISLRRKVRPPRTTLVANASFPIRDSSCRLVHLSRAIHFGMSLRSSVSLSVGRLISMLLVSMSIPRYVSFVVGPHSLSMAIGTLSSANVVLMVFSWSSASANVGGVAFRKSSR